MVFIAALVTIAFSIFAPTCTEDSQVSTIRFPDFPAGLLLQSQSADRNGALSGIRVWDDGRRDKRQRGGPWIAMNALSWDRLAALHAAITASGLKSSRAVPLVKPDDPAIYYLQIAMGGSNVSIAVESPCKIAAFDAFYAAVAQLLTE